MPTWDGSLMKDFEKRANDIKSILASKSVGANIINSSDEDCILGFHVEEDGEQFPVTAMISEHAFAIEVLIQTDDASDFGSVAEATQVIPQLKPIWMNCAAAVNASMDGLCYICVEIDDDPSLSVNCVSHGYYLSDAGAPEYICEQIFQTVGQAAAASVVLGELIEAVFQEAGV